MTRFEDLLTHRLEFFQPSKCRREKLTSANIIICHVFAAGLGDELSWQKNNITLSAQMKTFNSLLAKHPAATFPVLICQI